MTTQIHGVSIVALGILVCAWGAACENNTRVEPERARSASEPAAGRSVPEHPNSGRVGPGTLTPAFARVLDTVRATTRVPLRLPRVGWGDGYDDSTRITVSESVPNRYELILGNTLDEDCDGGTWCRIGTVTGERLRRPNPLPAGQPLTGPDGYRAVFTSATCGANCSDATVTWDEGAYRYTVGLKAGRLARVERMAASVPAARTLTAPSVDVGQAKPD